MLAGERSDRQGSVRRRVQAREVNACKTAASVSVPAPTKVSRELGAGVAIRPEAERRDGQQTARRARTRHGAQRTRRAGRPEPRCGCAARAVPRRRARAPRRGRPIDGARCDAEAAIPDARLSPGASDRTGSASRPGSRSIEQALGRGGDLGARQRPRASGVPSAEVAQDRLQPGERYGLAGAAGRGDGAGQHAGDDLLGQRAEPIAIDADEAARMHLDDAGGGVEHIGHPAVERDASLLQAARTQAKHARREAEAFERGPGGAQAHALEGRRGVARVLDPADAALAQRSPAGAPSATSSSGRAMTQPITVDDTLLGRGAIGAMAPSPSRPLPRASRMSSVSAWSSCGVRGAGSRPISWARA